MGTFAGTDATLYWAPAAGARTGGASTVQLRGRVGVVSWGYLTPASCRRWRVTRAPDQTWTLAATLDTVDRFVLARALKDRQFPVLFTAPRAKGRWCWPVQRMTVGDTTVTATLGPLEY